MNRYKTIEGYFIGKHQFKIQERNVPKGTQEFRVYHRWFGKNFTWADFIVSEAETESACRLIILMELQSWPYKLKRITKRRK